MLFRNASRLASAFRARVGARSIAQPSRAFAVASGLGLAVGATQWSQNTSCAASVDYAAVRAEIAKILDEDDYDDGSIGPILVRLAWHASGTYDAKDGSGGSDRASMRFDPEASHGANAGLHIARARLEPIKAKFPGISYADLWILAGYTAIAEMGGPDITFSPGRSDCADSKGCTPDGRLPDAAQGAQHLRDVFHRQGFNDQEIVALSGAHALGRCHQDRSGFVGPWTNAPTTFSNEYFRLLLDEQWVPKQWTGAYKGPFQFADKSTGTLMMLPTDIALTEDPEFKVWVEIYKNDEERFFKDFSKAFQKLTENGTSVSSGCNGCPFSYGNLVKVGFGILTAATVAFGAK